MRSFYILLFVLISLGGYAKNKPDVKRADKYFAKEAYAEAIAEYQRLSKREKDKPYVSLQLATCYDKIGKTVEAAKYYGKAISATQDIDSEVLYSYAQIATRNGRYEVADGVMKQFTQRADQNDPRVVDYAAFQNDLVQTQSKPASFLYAESGLNDLRYADFGLTKAQGDTVYFVSNRSKYKSKVWRYLFEVKDKKTDKPNYDLYQAEFKNRKDPLYNVTHIEGKVNKRFNDGIASVNPAGDILYFASDSYRNRKFRKDKTVKKRGEMKSLYSAVRKGKRWSKVKVLPFCEAGVIYTNPSVSPDGKYLYFSSNREGSIGKLDIWRVAILEKGTYGEPENLGNQVNRGGIEDYASVSTDNVLYFASDRWGGFGGLDIYQINLDNLNAKAENIGAPINTARDDYGFSFFPNQKIGFVSSNRIGREDVYRVYPLCNYPISFKVTNHTFHTPIDKANVVLIDDRQNLIDKGVTDANGQVTFQVDCGKYYQVQVKHADFVSKEKDFQAELTGDSHTIEMPLKPLEELRIENNEIVLQDIKFEFDKTELPQSGKQELDKLIQVLGRYPAMKVKINAHTDGKGKSEYNMQLSEERAASTAKYLYEKGISEDRVSHQGYGSTQPKVQCDPCTDAENAQNRRSEFIIITK